MNTFSPHQFDPIAGAHLKAPIELSDAAGHKAIGSFNGILIDPLTRQRYYSISRLEMKGTESYHFPNSKLPREFPAHLHLVPVECIREIKVLGRYLSNWVVDTRDAPTIVAQQLQTYPKAEQLARSILNRTDRVPVAAIPSQSLAAPQNPVLTLEAFARQATEHQGKIVEITSKTGHKMRGRLLSYVQCNQANVSQHDRFDMETLGIDESGAVEYSQYRSIYSSSIESIQVLAPDLPTLKNTDQGLSALIAKQQQGYIHHAESELYHNHSSGFFYRSFDPVKNPVEARGFIASVSRFMNQVVEVQAYGGKKMRGLLISLFKDSITHDGSCQYILYLAALEKDSANQVKYGAYHAIPELHTRSFQVLAPTLEALQAKDPNLASTVEEQSLGYRERVEVDNPFPEIGLSWTPNDCITEPPPIPVAAAAPIEATEAQLATSRQPPTQ